MKVAFLLYIIWPAEPEFYREYPTRAACEAAEAAPDRELLGYVEAMRDEMPMVQIECRTEIEEG
jgi:hypothetical protein